MANDVAKRLVARIRDLREAKGFTQESFAEHADLKYKHYQSVEAGRKTNLQLFTLIKIAKALGLDLKQLVDLDAVPMVVAEDPAEPDSLPTKKKGLPEATKPAAHTKKIGVIYKRRAASKQS